VYLFLYMKAITYTAARQKLASTMDWVCEDGTPVMITRTGKQQAVVLLSMAEYDRLEEDGPPHAQPGQCAQAPAGDR
jgi:prevent-host-death family protein